MGAKKNKNNEGDQKKNNGGDGGENAKKESPKSSVTVVLKVDMHCEGCASKIVKSVKGFEGVEIVKTEWEASKLTVTGKVDPGKIRERLAEKMKKKVDLVSPQPKKDESKDGKDSEKKSDDKKPKEPPVTTAVLKLSLHCQGCIEKIHRVLAKTKGIHEKCVDRQKDLLTVKGTMDVKHLVEALKKNLKRSVEIVPPKKEKDGGDKEKDGGGDNKEGGGGGGGGKKGKGGGGGKEGNGGGGQGNKMEYVAAPGFYYIPVDGYGHPYPLPYPQPCAYPHDVYGNVYAVPDQQMFSDENPNACSVM